MRAARRWTVGVLGVGTVALLVHATLLVAMAWLLGSVFEAVTARESVQVDLFAVAADVAPVLLLGWCSGMATSASIARGETLGARTAGVVSGTVGIVAALLVMRLTGLL